MARGGLVEVREDYVEENPSKQDLKSEDKRVKVLEEKVKEQEEKVKEQGEMLTEMWALIQSLIKEKGTGTPGGDNDDQNAAV
ncbi:hypothetical protein K1719_035275 [Acacia pycnantha]|nr:hypothetical protein K1719_035275 [Acacia pycnantha]